jgi:hypothetical protein
MGLAAFRDQRQGLLLPAGMKLMGNFRGLVKQPSQAHKTWREVKRRFFAAINLLSLDAGPSDARLVVEGLL